MRSSAGVAWRPATFAVDLGGPLRGLAREEARTLNPASDLGHIDPLLAVCVVLRYRAAPENGTTPVQPENNNGDDLFR